MTKTQDREQPGENGKPGLLKRVAFHPVVLAIYPVFFLYSYNTDQTDFATAIWPILLSPIVFGVLWLGVFAIVRDWLRSAVIASLIVVLFYAYGHIHYLIYNAILNYEIEVG